MHSDMAVNVLPALAIAAVTMSIPKIIASLNFVKMIPTEEMDKINTIMIMQQAYVRKLLYSLLSSCCIIDKPDQRL